MILAPSQLKAFRDGAQICADKAPQIEWLRKVAAVAPEYAERIQEVSDMHEHHSQLCAVAIAAAGE